MATKNPHYAISIVVNTVNNSAVLTITRSSSISTFRIKPPGKKMLKVINFIVHLPLKNYGLMGTRLWVTQIMLLPHMWLATFSKK